MVAYSSDTDIDFENVGELDALLRLLDDPDDTVAQAVQKKLGEYGGNVVPHLRMLLENDNSVFTRRNCELIIHEFQKNALATLQNSIISEQMSGNDISLEQAVILLSKFGYPETNGAAISKQLDEIALDAHRNFIRTSTTNDLTLLMSLNDSFFEQSGFRGATPDYKPEHSYFYSLLRSHVGIPISLSAAYMLVAERIGIELYGIGMPLHFLAFHPILRVYIDVFNFGVFISREDCKHFISKSNFDFNDSMLEKVSNYTMVIRMMRNLIYAHSRNQEMWEAEQLQNTLDSILQKK
jgi:regulator of sirC expression with transglutaminase-like and TPR domain